MNPDTLFLLFGTILSLSVLFIGVLIKEIQVHQDSKRKVFDKSDVVYRDGDNT